MASDITHAHGTRQSPYRSSALTFSTPSSHVCRKVIKGGKTLFCGPAKRSFGRDRGTTVTVRDIFHNVSCSPFVCSECRLNIQVPVRQRVLLSSPSAALAQCKRVLETMALVHPGVQWNMWEQRDDAMKGMKGEAKHILGVSALVSRPTAASMHGQRRDHTNHGAPELIRQCTRSIDVFRELYGRAGVEVSCLPAGATPSK